MATDAFDPKHPDLGWQPSIPEPFWNRGPRTLWRWRAMCVECRIEFQDRDAFGAHWLREHAKEESDADS